jgi:hypothetical protein
MALGRLSDAFVELMVPARQAEGPPTRGILWKWQWSRWPGVDRVGICQQIEGSTVLAVSSD